MEREEKHITPWIFLALLVFLAVVSWIYKWSDIFIVDIIAYVCSYTIYTNKYSYCSIEEFGICSTRRNETIMLIWRWIHYAIGMYVAFRSIKDEFCNPPEIVLPLAILLANDFFQSFSRTTFRVLPSYILSAAATMLFLVFAVHGYQYRFSDDILFLHINGPRYAAYLNGLPSVFTNSAVIVAISPVFLAVAKYMIDKYRAQATENSLKITRRHLLAHVWYNPKNVLNDNSNLWISIGIVLACLIAVIINLPNEKKENNWQEKRNFSMREIIFAPVYTMQHSAEEIIEKYMLSNQNLQEEIEGKDLEEKDNQGEKESREEEKNQKEETTISFLEYLSIFSSALAVLGIVLLYEVRERELLRSEYYYLKYYAPMIKNLCVDKKLPRAEQAINGMRAHLTRRMYGRATTDKAMRWLRDYCQVLGHLFTSSSAIRSENEDMHNIRNLVETIGTDIENGAIKSIAVTEMIYAFQKAQNQSMAETEKTDKKEDEEQSETSDQMKIPSAGEHLFAGAIKAFVNAAAKKDNCCFALKCLKIAQDASESALETLRVEFDIGGQAYSLKEIEEIINVDVIRQIALYRRKSKCVLSGMCKESCECISDLGEGGQEKLDARALLVVYPILTVCSILERYPELVSVSVEGERFVQEFILWYFIKLAKRDTASSGVTVSKLWDGISNVSDWESEAVHKEIVNIFRLISVIINSQKKKTKEALKLAVMQFTVKQAVERFISTDNGSTDNTSSIIIARPIPEDSEKSKIQIEMNRIILSFGRIIVSDDTSYRDGCYELIMATRIVESDS